MSFSVEMKRVKNKQNKKEKFIMITHINEYLSHFKWLEVD